MVNMKNENQGQTEEQKMRLDFLGEFGAVGRGALQLQCHFNDTLREPLGKPKNQRKRGLFRTVIVVDAIAAATTTTTSSTTMTMTAVDVAQ